MTNPKRPSAPPGPHASTATAPAGHVEDSARLSDEGALQQPRFFSRTAETDANSTQAGRIHLLIGPVGAGKSTFALGLARQHGALQLTLDAWMAQLFRPDRPEAGVMEWYVERAARCVEQIMAVASAVVALGTDVILEIGLLRREERRAFYRRVDAAGFDLRVYVLDAPRDVRRERVNQRNRQQGATFVMIVPPEIFELASDLWEPPERDEHESRDVRVVKESAPE